MRSAILLLALVSMLTGAFLLATGLKATFSTIPMTQDWAAVIGNIDWPNVIVGSLLSLSGGALINYASRGSGTRSGSSRRRK